MPTFSEHVRGLSDSALTALLLARPDLTLPAPTSLASLTARATNRSSLERALTRLDAFTLQVLEAVVALDPVEPITRTRLARALPGAPKVALGDVLDQLTARGLVWGARHLHPAPGLPELLGPYPAGLGPVTGQAADLDALTDAPAGSREILDALAWGPPVGREPASRGAAPAVDALVDRGLLQRADGHLLLLPREVGLALRGGRTHRAAVHAPPAITSEPVPVERVDAASLTAADDAVHHVHELVVAWRAEPPAALRAGGLGVRDLRRVATRLDVPEDTAGLVIELAAAAGLVADDGGAVARYAPTPLAEEWLTHDLPERWAALARAWWTTARTPWLIGTRDARGSAIAPLGPDLQRPWVAPLRAAVLGVLTDHPGRSASADAVLDVLEWRTPRAVPPRHAIEQLLAEAQVLGVTAHGAISTAGAALVRGEDPASALAQVLPPAVDDLLLQGDLTGIVPGRPTRELAALLDVAAVLESRGGALTVRFTDASVTGALEAGLDGDALLARLAHHSRTGVPQPLEYLVRDATRRYGRLRVGEALSYVRSDDPALLAGLASNPRLRALGLRELAPTVLVASAPADELVPALRALGLVPVSDGAQGTVVRQGTGTPSPDDGARPVAVPSARGGAGRPGQGRAAHDLAGPVLPEPADVRRERVTALVARLRSAAPTPSDAPGRRTADAGTSDPSDALTRLREAIDAGRDVVLHVIDASGRPDRRTVRPLHLEAGRLRALDVAREAELTVAVHRIARVDVVGAADPPEEPHD